MRCLIAWRGKPSLSVRLLTVVKDQAPKFVFACPAEEISSYIDGELSAELEVALERHIGACAVCRRELNDQKGFLIALSDTLEREVELELPENFAKTVVVNAESNVAGIRGRRERYTAFWVIAVMLLLAAVAVGGSIAGLFGPVWVLFQKLGAVIAMIGQIAIDLVFGVSVFFRSFAASQTFYSLFAYIALSLAAAAAVYFISRSLRRFFRTQGTE